MEWAGQEEVLIVRSMDLLNKRSQEEKWKFDILSIIA